MTIRRRRRRRVLLLRARRLLARHHFSLVSAVVLAVALSVALTDGEFAFRERADAVGTVTAAGSRDAVTKVGTRPVARAQTGWVIYYIVDSARQMDALGTVIRGEADYRDDHGAFSLPSTAVYYLVFDTPQQEIAGAMLLNKMAELAPIEGFNLKVIDLTE